MTIIKKNEIWLVNLDPGYVTETGKTRAVLVVQNDALNKVHSSTLICLITTNVKPESNILRVNLKKRILKVKEDCDIMIDQLRSIDNKRLIKKIGDLPKETAERVKGNIKIVLDLDE